jgi:hypothetical protein
MKSVRINKTLNDTFVASSESHVRRSDDVDQAFYTRQGL